MMRKIWLGPLISFVLFALLLHYLGEKSWDFALLASAGASLVAFLLNYIAYKKQLKRTERGNGVRN